MMKSDAIKNDPVCMPEDVIAISKWGDGNYFLEDRQIGVTLKITPALYWELVEKAQEVFEVAELNGWRADK